MDTSLDLIRAKISELELQITNLRIAERELEALDKPSSRRNAEKPVARKTRTPRKVAAAADPEASPAEHSGKMTIGATITDILNEHGALSVGGIAEQVATSGRDISNRAISFTLQALKKRGLVKSANGEWSLPKARGRRAAA